MTSPLKKYSVALLWLFCAAFAPAQNVVVNFDFEHGKEKYNASVSLYLKVGGKIIMPHSTVDIKDGKIDLYSNNLKLANGGPVPSDVRIILECSESCVKLSDNLEFEVPGSIVSLKSTGRAPIKLKGAGYASVKVLRILVGPKGSEEEVKPNSSDILQFTIVDETKPLPPPTSAPPPTLTDPTPPDTRSSTKTTSSEKPKPAEKPKDLTDYDEALKKNGKEKIDALKAFLKAHPRSGKAAEAQKMIPIEFVTKTETGSDIRKYLLRYVSAQCQPQITVTKNEASIQRDSNWLSALPNGDYLLIFKTTSSRDAVEIEVTDLCKNPEFRKSTLQSGEPLTFQLDSTENEFRLTLKGGDPLYLEFEQGDQRFPRVLNLPGTNTTFTFSKADVRQTTDASGSFNLRIIERSVTTEVGGTIYVPPAPPIWPYIAGVAALILGILLISRYRSYARNKAMQAKAKKFEETRQADAQWSEPEPGALSASAVKIRSAAPQTDPKALSEADFDAILKKGGYRRLNLKQQWPDTVLNEVHLSQNSIEGISSFLDEQRAKVMDDEQEGSIPEIGGFLLGKYCFSEKTKHYRVILQEFVPVVPEEHNVYQLHFSTESLVRELGDMQDEYPELSLVGWFHTHPGHGLFLSRPDLTIHDGFFKEPYQFALEIDTLTPELDTGFFTRTAAGTVNNQDALAPEAQWFHWTNIRKQKETA